MELRNSKKKGGVPAPQAERNRRARAPPAAEGAQAHASSSSRQEQQNNKRVRSKPPTERPSRRQRRAGDAGPSTASNREGTDATARAEPEAQAPPRPVKKEPNSRSTGPEDPAGDRTAAMAGNSGGEERAEQAEEAQAHAQAVAEAEQAAQAAREDYRGGMSALQHLLSKIGSGIDEAGFVSLVAGPGAGAKARYKEIVDRMVAPESDAHLVTALEDLSTALSMANEDQLASFPLDIVSPVLVRCLQESSANPNMAVYASRIVAWLADIAPQASCHALVQHGVVGALCARLLDIEFIDVAEACIEALSKLSLHVPETCLKQGGMMATLSYLSFLPDVVQRTAVTTAAAMAARASADTMPVALEVVPHLLNLLDDCKDAAILNSACSALNHITTAASRDESQAAIIQVAEYGVIEKVLSVVDVSPAGAVRGHISPSAFFLLLSTVTTCARASPSLAHRLLDGGMHASVKSLLENSDSAAGSVRSTAVIKTQQQLLQVLQLLEALLPSMPRPTDVVPEASLDALDAHAHQDSVAKRLEYFSGNASLRAQLAADFLPLVHKLHTVHSLTSIRSVSISILVSLLYLATPEDLQNGLRDVPFSSFVKSLLCGEDTEAVAAGCLLSQLMLSKLPSIFVPAFAKEGTYISLKHHAAKAPAPPKPKLQVRTRAMAKRNAPEPPEPELAPATMAESCAIVARNLVNEHFKESSKIDTEGLRTLRALTARLAIGGDSTDAFHEFVDLLEDASAVSAFELEASGILPALVKFLSGKGLGSDKQKLARLHSSAARLMSRKGGVTAGSVSGEYSVVAVAKKLVSVLETMDEFELKTTPQPRFAPSAFSRSRGVNFASMSQYHQALYALTQPLKLTLRAAPGSKLRDCTASTVLVEPLARLSAVEDFVTSRARPHEPGRGSSAGGSGRGAGGASTSGGLGSGRFTAKVNASREAAAAAAAAAAPDSATQKRRASGFASSSGSGRLAAAAAAAAAARAAPAVVARAIGEVAAGAAAKRSGDDAAQPAGDEDMEQGGNDLDAGDTEARAGEALRKAFEDAQQQDDEDQEAELQAVRMEQEGMYAASEEEGLDDGALEEMLQMEQAARDALEYEEAMEAQAEAMREEMEGAEIDEDDEDMHDDDDEDDNEDDEGLDDEDDMDGAADLPTVQDLQLEDASPDHASAEGGSDGEAAPAAAGTGAAAAAVAASAAAAAAAGTAAAPHGTVAARRSSGDGREGGHMREGGTRGGSGPSVSVLRRGSGGSPADTTAPTRSVVLLVDGKPLARNLTVLQAAMQAAQAAQPAGAEPLNAGSLWGEAHTIQYSLASEAPAQEGTAEHQAGTSAAAAAAGATATAPPLSGCSPRAHALQATASRNSGPQCSRDMHLVAAVSGAAAAPLSGFPDMPRCVLDCLVLLRMLESIATIPSHTESLLSSAIIPSSASVNLYEDPSSVQDGTFHSTRTNARLLSQLNDIVAICSQTLPPWVAHLPHEFKCLLPFSTRRRYLLLTSFDVPRTLTVMNNLMRDDGAIADGANGGGGAGGGGGANGAAQGLPEIRVARIPRQKVRVSRQRILDSAIKVFGMSMSVKSVLEFEFFNEVGTGLGPTLEFYTLLAIELRQRSLGLWQDHHRAADDDNAKPVATGAAACAAAGGAAAPRPVVVPPAVRRSTSVTAGGEDAVHAPAGLFPRPYMPGRCPKKVIATFDMMGKAVAKCIQDGRMMDLDLSLPFLSLVQRKPLDFTHLEALDPVTANSLLKIKATAKSAKSRRGASRLDGCKVDDLCLYFTLPGYPDYELCPGGKDKQVTGRNAEEYCNQVVAAILEKGVRAQVDAFLSGIDSVLDSRQLQCLYERELDVLLRGVGEEWTTEGVLDAIKCDHGYSRSSPAVLAFVTSLTELSHDERRALLRFVTGSPRLPPGGLAALRPRLTIVKKHGQGDGDMGAQDNELPSVMTCANYIKLPQYSSKDVCMRQLRIAITEGQGSFDLS